MMPLVSRDPAVFCSSLVHRVSLHAAAGTAAAILWRRVPALNTDPAFIEDMADMVVEALALPTLTVSEVRFADNRLLSLGREGG